MHLNKAFFTAHGTHVSIPELHVCVRLRLLFFVEFCRFFSEDLSFHYNKLGVFECVRARECVCVV